MGLDVVLVYLGEVVEPGGEFLGNAMTVPVVTGGILTLRHLGRRGRSLWSGFHEGPAEKEGLEGEERKGGEKEKKGGGGYI